MRAKVAQTENQPRTWKASRAYLPSPKLDSGTFERIGRKVETPGKPPKIPPNRAHANMPGVRRSWVGCCCRRDLIFSESAPAPGKTQECTPLSPRTDIWSATNGQNVTAAMCTHCAGPLGPFAAHHLRRRRLNAIRAFRGSSVGNAPVWRTLGPGFDPWAGHFFHFSEISPRRPQNRRVPAGSVTSGAGSVSAAAADDILIFRFLAVPLSFWVKIGFALSWEAQSGRCWTYWVGGCWFEPWPRHFFFNTNKLAIFTVNFISAHFP